MGFGGSVSPKCSNRDKQVAREWTDAYLVFVALQRLLKPRKCEGMMKIVKSHNQSLLVLLSRNSLTGASR